jgi:D-alanyl-D-alanine carboxypeptidase (penicillin-binding protein 5/6)
MKKLLALLSVLSLFCQLPKYRIKPAVLPIGTKAVALTAPVLASASALTPALAPTSQASDESADPIMSVPTLPAPETSAQGMATMDTASKRILTQKNASARLPMASTTKIMTAITVIKNADIKKTVKIDPEAVGIEGSSIYLQSGEQLTVEQLLYGLMLQSGNDCAVALAIATAGSVEKFAVLMNELALSLGARDSNFVNPHGLHDKNHYTTAYDLCLISCYAMEDPTFKTIVSTKSIKIPFAGRDYDRVINNKNKILNTFEGGNGVKTGFTKAAGRCLVSAAERDSMQIVCVVLNCGPMFEDCADLMTWAFKVFERCEILQPYRYAGEIDVLDGKAEKVKLYSKNGFSYTVKKGSGEFDIRVEIPEKLTAPVTKNAETGKIKIYYDNQLIFSDKVYTMEGVERESLFDKIFRR